jgi:CRISPR system Cascade subunit CasB
VSEPDFIGLYDDFRRLDTTRQNLLKRAVSPEDLIEIPAFYDLYRKHLEHRDQRTGLLRLIFCLPYITHHEGGKSLGAALAAKGKDGRVKVGEKRVIQMSRIEDNFQAMKQLRRVLKQVETVLDWSKAAKTIWYWGKNSRRQLLEDYFLALPSKTN